MKIKHYSFLIILSVFTTFIISSCSPYKHISKDGYLLSKNKVYIDNNILEKEDFVNLIKQDPNGTFLFVKWSMYFYSLSEKGEDSTVNFFSRNVFRALGNKPVEFDQNLSYISTQEMNRYLQIKGCFDGVVKDSIKNTTKWYNSKKINPRKVEVIYYVNTGERYKIDSFYISYIDTTIKPSIEKIMKNSPIKKGIYYDENLFSSEREKLERKLREEGYFDFTKENIIFKIDTNNNNHTAKVNLLIKSPKLSNSDSLLNNKHKLYKIRRIYVYPDYQTQLLTNSNIDLDTNIFFHRQKKDFGLNQYFFITPIPQKINSKPILRCIMFQYDSLFSPLQSERTYTALSQLKNFKFIDISYSPVEHSLLRRKSDTLQLDCTIKLSLYDPLLLSTSLEANFSAATNSLTDNNNSNFGIQWNLSLQHRNMFKNAEIFSSNAKVAIEIRSDIFNMNDTVDSWSLVNAFETGIDFGLEIPRFLIPFGTSFYSMQFLPHTSIKSGYNFQKRPYFERSIFNLNYGYSWNNSNKHNHAIIPVEINLVKMKITSQEYADLIKTFDKRMQYQTSDHLVMNTRYSYLYNDQELNKKNDFQYFRINAEVAGNFLYLMSNITNSEKNLNKEYTIFGIPYAQYFRTDFDYKKYTYFDDKNLLVVRSFFGFGVPYSNANSLPYEKSFFGGGANNLRAWQLRELGPGSSKVDKSQLRYDRSGDISFGANLEYRFPIAGVIEGATFLDIGNVWTINYQKEMDGGQFKFDRFYKEIAAGMGLGIRLNIQFLIIRLDFAIKLWNPAQELSQRWVLPHTKLTDLNVNFGIGYPF